MEILTQIDKLTELYQRLATEQQQIVKGVAAQQLMPTDSMLRYIADLESVLTAVDAMIEDAQASE